MAQAGHARPRLPARPFLYPLTDSRLGGAPDAELVSRLFRSGARIVQLRGKGLADRVLFEQASAAVAAARAAGGLLIVNDRVDVALASGADGVHLGGDDLPLLAARRLGPGLLIGVSTHGEDEALAAAGSDCDYVALGPIFASPTKPGRPPLGLEVLRRVRARTDRPLVAIGGIGLEQLREVRSAGADGIALVSAVMQPGPVGARLAELQVELERP